jgi:putative flippase GtrA
VADALRWLHRSQSWQAQAARFLVVGVLAAGVDYGVLRLGMAAGLGAGVARVPSVAVAIVFTWWLNRNLTFRTAARPSLEEFAKYVATAFAAILINLGVYLLLLWLGLPLEVAFVAGVGTSAVFNFVRYRAILGRS